MTLNESNRGLQVNNTDEEFQFYAINFERLERNFKDARTLSSVRVVPIVKRGNTTNIPGVVEKFGAVSKASYGRNEPIPSDFHLVSVFEDLNGNLVAANTIYERSFTFKQAQAQDEITDPVKGLKTKEDLFSITYNDVCRYRGNKWADGCPSPEEINECVAKKSAEIREKKTLNKAYIAA